MKKLNTLLELQRRQQRHDVVYHPDILSLNTADRLKHMALHNAKYAAKMSDAEHEKNDQAFEKILVDAFVISLATANTLTTNLDETICSNTNNEFENLRPFSQRYLQQVGLMAKACESIDHVEDFPFRKTIKLTNLNIVGLIILEAKHRELDIYDLYVSRLTEVEENSGFRMFDNDVGA